VISALDEPDPRPARRKRWLWAVAIVLLLAVVVGEWVASRIVAGKLRALVAEKLDAKLELGTLLYIPPYGAWLSSARLVRDGHALVSVGRVKLKLARSPLAEGPIIIASVTANQPQLDLRPRGFDDIAKPSAAAENPPPRKLSGVLRLEKLRFFDGKVTYTDDVTGGAPPMTWTGLTVDIDTVQKSPSLYSYRVSSRAFPLADASVSGTIDVDSLMLEVQSLALKARTEPEPSRTALPAPVQDFIRRYRISGAIAVNGTGTVPLKEADQAAFTVTLALQNATARFVAGGETLDHARASLVCQKPKGGPVTVRIDRIDVGLPNKTMLIDAGQCVLDPASATWELSQLRGRVQFIRPVRSSGASLTDHGVATTQPKGLDRFEPAGRGEFAASASGPLEVNGRKWWEAIRHEVILYPRRASFRPKDFAGLIEDINGGEVRLSDGTMLFQELSGRYGDDALRLRSARIPVDGLPKVTQWREISGSVTFNPPTRKYSPKLDKILGALNPRGHFLIAGSWTVDKTLEDPRQKHSYDLIVSSDNGGFVLTPKQIEITGMRGDATVTRGGVDLHAVEAEVLGGKMQVTGLYRRGEDGVAKYDGEAHFQNVDLARLEDKVRQERAAKPLEGRLFAEVVFDGAVTKGAPAAENLRHLHAQGEFEVIDGHLFKMPVLKEIARDLHELKEAAVAGSAAAVFDIDKGIAHLRDVAISSPVVGLQGGGKIAFDGPLELNVVAAPLADWRDKLKETKIPIVSDVAGEVAGGIQKLLNSATGALLYEFRIGGTVQNVTVTTVPTPVLTDTAAHVFGKMLSPEKSVRPRDWLRPREPRAEVGKDGIGR
jgi:hypothetical protein